MSQSKKPLNKWTLTQLKKLPERKWDEPVAAFDSLIIIPTDERHDSGYRCMEFIAVRDDIPFLRLSGISDALHLDGVGGIGLYGPTNDLRKLRSGWSIDCLATSGLLRLFSGLNKRIRVGLTVSSFEIFSIEEEAK